jgi:hypothetical protein
VSSLRRGHANLLCIVPILSDVSEETKEGGERPGFVPVVMTSSNPYGLYTKLVYVQSHVPTVHVPTTTGTILRISKGV